MRPDIERLLEASYRMVVGRELRADAGGEPYDAPAALLMHGNEADPVFCYANRTAQGLWGLTWDEFIRLPSRALRRAAGPGRTRPLARTRAHPWIHRRLPGRADREGRHALPHLGRDGVDGGG